GGPVHIGGGRRARARRVDRDESLRRPSGRGHVEDHGIHAPRRNAAMARDRDVEMTARRQLVPGYATRPVPGVEDTGGRQWAIGVLRDRGRTLDAPGCRAHARAYRVAAGDHRHVVEGRIRRLEGRLADPLRPEPGIVDQHVTVGYGSNDDGVLIWTPELDRSPVEGDVVRDAVIDPVERRPGNHRMARHHRLVDGRWRDALAGLSDGSAIGLCQRGEPGVINAVPGEPDLAAVRVTHEPGAGIP